MGRMLTFKIFRFNPYDDESRTHIREYTLEETPRLNIFNALNMIRDTQDPTLMFDFVCRAGICGSCAMMINGRPTLACRTLTSDMPPVIELFPLPFFKMLGDLSVDTGVWFREIAEKLESWIHTDEEFNPKKEEKRMDNELANRIYEHDRCIECGCCIAGCATINVKPDFLGAAGLNRIARYMIDPRDGRNPETWYELVSTYEGIFGCIGMMACEDVCPKDIPLLETFSRVRRLMVSTGIFGKREMLTVKR